MKNKIIVLTNQRGYNQVRNILSRDTNLYKTIRKRDLSSIIYAFFYKCFGKSHIIFLQSYLGPNFEKQDLIHLWNGICTRSKPWVTTLEMPDYMGYRKDSLLIKIKRYYWKSKYCKKIIFTSKWAKQNTLSKWSKYYNRQIYNQIVEKSTILHPPQKRPILNLVEKK